MATRYSKEKHAHIKGMKNEPLSQLATDPKRQKLNKEKGETLVSSSVQTIPSSPTLSLEVMAVTPPITCSKEKSKIGKSLWEGLATTLGRAHKVITNDKLKSLTSIPSHELVLGESLRLTTDHHSNEKKVVMANSKIESVEVESSKLMKDLIEAMDIANKAKEKVQELSEELRVEKMLVVQKDEKIQAALLQIDSKRQKIIQKFMKSEQFSDL